MRLGAATALLCLLGVTQTSCSGYWGAEVGSLSELHHAVRGKVYAVDSRTLYLRDFHYDGEGPAAYFYAGSSGSAEGASGGGGRRVRDERGAGGPLRRYRGEHLVLTLPDGLTLQNLKWFSVWCEEFSVNFGSVSIPRELQYPRPVKLDALRGVHGVSSDALVVVDAQTLLLPNFSYDGEAPDAKFWVGRGEKPSPQGIRIPDENGKETPLRKYDKKTIVLTLPGELTVFDIGYFSVWCEAFTVNFGHVTLPRDLQQRVPPSLKMLGVSPQSKLNCEVLYEDMAFEVRWAVAGDSIVLQLVAKLEDGEYMSFGLSGSASSSQMVGGDVAVAWLDKTTLKGYAHDYYLDAKSQCAGVRGSCPDERLGAKTNSLRLLNAALVNGYSIVTYQRSLRAADQLDRAILTNVSQPIIWATGPLNSRNEVSYHSNFLKGDKFIEFGRPPVWNCPMPETEEDSPPPPTPLPHPENNKPEKDSDSEKADEQVAYKPHPVPPPRPAPRADPWDIPPIQCHEPADGVFYAQMGPTGGKQGYPAITGHVGWGISWYINGLLIPEINVVRGRKYTFVVEGGSDPEVPARYHPFYITNDPVGGFFHKSEAEKKGVEIYAGVRQTRAGSLVPTGVGRLCNWTPDSEGAPADEYPSFGAYQRSLTLVCEEGNPGVVTWVPSEDTPDTVYYQCFTHRHLGWKINVMDECEVAEESRRAEQRVSPPSPPSPASPASPPAPPAAPAASDLLQGEESVQVYTRLKPNNELDQRKKYEKIINAKKPYNDFSKIEQNDSKRAGDESRPEQSQPQPELEPPISSSQIRSVIELAENLQTSMKDEFIKNIKLSPNTFYKEGNMKDPFLPEQPLREDEDFTVEPGNVPNKYMLPPNQKPLTLQSVLRPHNPHGPPGMSHSFRRPAPPEIKRRPHPPHAPHAPHNVGHMGNMGNMGNTYPLSMPAPHGPHAGNYGPNMKKYNKHPVRLPPNMNMNRPADRPPSKMKHHGLNPQKQNPNNMPNGMQNNMPNGMQNNMLNGMQNNMPNVMPNSMQNNMPNGVPNGLPQQSIIMGKPINLPPQSQTLSLGKTDIIANQVVKSQIMLPGFNEPVSQHSAPIPEQFLVKPVRSDVGQIILGKPMENPVPLDQQMTPTKQYPVRVPEMQIPKFDIDQSQQYNTDIKSSDFMGESPGISTVVPAVNTGFKPDSIVIESGFKPIIREPLMERNSEEDNQNANRREDTNLEEDYVELPPVPQYTANNFPSEQNTQSFEPMFIPSPEDHMLPTNDKTTEVFPSNHAKEDRPHPVYIKSDSELSSLFSKKNVDKEVPSEMVMESNRVSPQYLPPDPKHKKEPSQKVVAEETFTTYDGKTVSAVSLTALPQGVNFDTSNFNSNKNTTKLFSSKLPNKSELLLRTPQFRPFKGEIPPLENIKTPELLTPSSTPQTTNLKLMQLLNSFFDTESSEDTGDVKAEASDKHEVTQKSPNTEEDEKAEDDENEDEYEDDDETPEDGTAERKKRETRTTQFESGSDNFEANFVKDKDTHIKNHIEFEGVSSATKSHHHWLLNSVLLLLLFKNL